MEQIAESTDKPKKSVLQKAARIGLVIGVMFLLGIVLFIVGFVADNYNFDRDIQRTESKARIEEKRQQLHIENLKGLQAEMIALHRLSELRRSARTEKELAFVRSELAKLQNLTTERERVMKAAKAELERMQ
jgi:hypothetical protein